MNTGAIAAVLGKISSYQLNPEIRSSFANAAHS